MNVNSCINALVKNLDARIAVISPGSRNAPVIYALHQSTKECYSVIDERSAGFIALGMAKHLKEPIILNCTSGTAALNYYPAITEAFYARVPLIVLTADRPPEQIDAWDGQAIRQQGVFSNHIRASFNAPSNYNSDRPFEEIARKVNSYWTDEIPGPIHINIPIREPFYNVEQFEDSGFKRVLSKRELTTVSLPSIANHVYQDFANKKVLIFNGMEDGENIVIANGNDGVMLSDITSNQTSDVFYWDAMLFSLQSKVEQVNSLSGLAPEILITTGTTTVSKGLKRFLQMNPPAQHYHISRFNEVGNMFGTSPVIINPDQVKPIDEAQDDFDGLRDGPFIENWLKVCKGFELKFSQLDWTSYNEFSAVNYVVGNLPSKAIVHLANSMAVRYVSFIMNSGVANNLVYGNRGTSGIDGCTSTSLGNALVCTEPVFLLTGDVAFLYDINAFFRNEIPSNLKVVLLNNSGGRIFEMISGPDKMGDAINLQTTPHSFNAEQLAEHFKLNYIPVRSISELAEGVEELMTSENCTILEVFTDKEKDAEFFDLFKAL
jgi:2-succinyl-5-enolpyruvyl-6-hydroxy-3-cyclohexene-1-carboxylate synthase